MKRRGLLLRSKLLFFIVFVFCLGANKISIADPGQSVYSSKNDSIKIFSNYYTEKDLDNVTPEFLRYARNYFFAKQGYVFKDSCLNVFFENQDWYKPIKAEINLSEKEKIWIERIKQKEENYSQNPPLKLISSYNFNQRPLFYIASELRYNEWKKKEIYRNGHFYLLKPSDIWALSCQDVPLELIQEMAQTKLWCKDDPNPMKNEDITIENFDEGCLKGNEQEVVVRLYGPGSTDEHNIIGFDAEGDFSILIKDVYIQSKEVISDSIVRIKSYGRCDRIGTEFCTKEYDFNSVTRKMSLITKAEYQHILPTRTLEDSVMIFKSEEDAINRNFKSIAFIVPPDTKVYISHFLGKDNVFLIEYNHKIGWIGVEDLHKFWISFAG